MDLLTGGLAGAGFACIAAGAWRCGTGCAADVPVKPSTAKMEHIPIWIVRKGTSRDGMLGREPSPVKRNDSVRL